MVKAVNIPVTVKMRKGWDDDEMTAPDVARRVEDAGAAAITIHGRTAKQSYSGTRGLGFRRAHRRCADDSGVRVRRLRRARADRRAPARRASAASSSAAACLRNPWILAQAQDLLEGRPARGGVARRARAVSARLHRAAAARARSRGRRAFVIAHRAAEARRPPARQPRHDRWVINKLRALCSWYTRASTTGRICGSRSTRRESLRAVARPSIDGVFSWLQPSAAKTGRPAAGTRSG